MFILWSVEEIIQKKNQNPNEKDGDRQWRGKGSYLMKRQEIADGGWMWRRSSAGEDAELTRRRGCKKEKDECDERKHRARVKVELFSVSCFPVSIRIRFFLTDSDATIRLSNGFCWLSQPKTFNSTRSYIFQIGPSCNCMTKKRNQIMLEIVWSRDKPYFIPNQVVEPCFSNYESYLKTHFKLRSLKTPWNMWTKSVFLL